MRSTTRLRSTQAARARAYAQNWGNRLALGLRVLLAASTMVVTFVVLTQDLAEPQTRWLLATLTGSLFILTLVGSRPLLREGGARRSRSEAGHVESPGRTEVVSPGSVEDAKIRQLTLHKTDFAATVSHELRTPLTSIHGFAQMLTREALPAEVTRAYAATILNEADRLSRIIDDMVALTRMESALLELRRDPIPTADLIQDTISHLRLSHSPERLQVSLPHGGSLPWLHGDREKLGQALLRLVLEALSYSDSETPLKIHVASRDNAVEISLHFQASPERIAGMEQTAESLWKCHGDGIATRLGRGEISLYVARNLIEAHGGHITVESLQRGDVRVSIAMPC